MQPLPELSLLRALVIFSRSSSLSEAAATLGVTQPTLSYQLRRLETELPVPVFTFQGKRKILTHYGRSLRDLAEAQLDAMDKAYEGMNRQYLSAEKLQLRIGCRRDRFMQVEKCIRFPGTMFFEDLSAAHALTALQDHRLDIAIVHDKPDLPGLVAKHLFSSANRFVVHRKWLKAHKVTGGSVERMARDKTFLETTPCLRYRERDTFLMQWLHATGANLAQMRYRYTCQDWEALIRWAADGEGYAIVPTDLPLVPGLEYWDIPGSELAGVHFYAVFHKDLRRIPGFGRDLVIQEFAASPR